uniref:Selenoprotein U1b n=1 Tax=Amphiprion percula TaxID=161767 RepID=A0A3P8UCP3_AMPPE
MMHNMGQEIPIFQGIWTDEKRCFYGIRERKISLLGFLRVRFWMNGLRTFKNGFMGHVLGEGLVLGGVFGQGEQGILLEHRETEFVDKVNSEEVFRSVRRKSQELQHFEKK